jgi:hypothetical protein
MNRTLYYGGLGVVVASHWMMLNMEMPDEWRELHAQLNLAAAAAIFIGDVV